MSSFLENKYLATPERWTPRNFKRQEKFKTTSRNRLEWTEPYSAGQPGYRLFAGPSYSSITHLQDATFFWVLPWCTVIQSTQKKMNLHSARLKAIHHLFWRGWKQKNVAQHHYIACFFSLLTFHQLLLQLHGWDQYQLDSIRFHFTEKKFSTKSHEKAKAESAVQRRRTVTHVWGYQATLHTSTFNTKGASLPVDKYK